VRSVSSVLQMDVAVARSEQTAGALLLDVREQDEWDAGHAPGALHIPMSELQERFVELPDADATLVICRSGHRSDVVAAALARIGRPGCANVAGGMQAWAGAGLPVEPAGGRVL
jgi:rhodanese-related sulfurtransferase